VVHHHREAAPPLGWEYDIREIDVDLFTAVLACRFAENRRPDGDLS
jgi:hypothetical protein